MKFNSKAEKNLIRLLSETNASIVLTTTHRITYSVEKWKEIFNNRDIPVLSIEKVNTRQAIDEMPDRCIEIKEWVDNFGTGRQFVIIDDDLSINSLLSDIKDKRVTTKSMIGLDDECTERAIRILKGY
ncbi:hypothetical protein MYP_3043 [Sporocytophaga myxococcoides]|uniref:Uncharacterized protein n=1 Tax=Sporocytophaga myxococcoides TaxID=153721 RepID=A0A098LH95_9BACT|nr:hypothetical protein MYP_3043 [Sporocytophaga myxococcoides]